MLLDDKATSSTAKHRTSMKLGLLGVVIVILIGITLGILYLRNRLSKPKEAPEAEAVLEVQVALPFQVLIPAYLPKIFVRQDMQLKTDQLGPNGEPMVQLVYPTRRGDTLTFYEWLPRGDSAETQQSYCSCKCMSKTECNFSEMGLSIGTLRVLAKVTSLQLVTAEEARAIVDTLGPAMNRQVYSALKDVPVTYAVPPAVDVPLNSEGIQEITLVVTPNGYSPAHFAVKKGIPVRLIFRQTGLVGCGNQLIIEYGEEKSATLTLTSAGDAQTLEFTPRETGDFRFSCPHLIYRGVMTVNE